MARIVYDSNGNKLGSWDGNHDWGEVYDAEGNYAGKYYDNMIFNKDGADRGYHDGDPEETVRILLEK